MYEQTYVDIYVCMYNQSFLKKQAINGQLNNYVLIILAAVKVFL